MRALRERTPPKWTTWQDQDLFKFGRRVHCDRPLGARYNYARSNELKLNAAPSQGSSKGTKRARTKRRCARFGDLVVRATTRNPDGDGHEPAWDVPAPPACQTELMTTPSLFGNHTPIAFFVSRARDILFPKYVYAIGRTKSVRTVAVTRPPITTVAKGR